MKISELKPGVKEEEFSVRIVELNEPKEVQSKADGTSHKVAEALVGDESGVVLLTLWDEKIDAVKAGESYKLTKCYTTTFQDHLRLNVGREGTIEKADAIDNVNRDLNMSDKLFPRPRFGGGRRFGGGFGGGRRFGGGGFGRGRGGYGRGGDDRGGFRKKSYNDTENMSNDSAEESF